MKLTRVGCNANEWREPNQFLNRSGNDGLSQIEVFKYFHREAKAIEFLTDIIRNQRHIESAHKICQRLSGLNVNPVDVSLCEESLNMPHGIQPGIDRMDLSRTNENEGVVFTMPNEFM